MNIKIVFEAKARSIDDITDLRNNFNENYPEFARNMNECENEYTYKDGMVHIAWEGNFDKTFCNKDNINELIRLTHHAEGLYEDTDLEYVHVEVFVDGVWYGRS